ncbi:MAG: hypothetical protein GC160_02955 [Acidobacteria bacterium]|nr:hypothetical protein [Acidobacteriota bacterium]
MTAQTRVCDAAELGKWLEQWIEWRATEPTSDELDKIRDELGDDAVRRKLRQRPAPDLPLGVDEWCRHLSRLEELASAGCQFGLDDLTAAEWRGRSAYRAARERFWRRYRPCPGCERPILRIARGHDCGWRSSEQ